MRVDSPSLKGFMIHPVKVLLTDSNCIDFTGVISEGKYESNYPALTKNSFTFAHDASDSP